MDTQFATFKPIQLNPNPSKEEISSEYKSRNETLDNGYLDKLFGLDKAYETPVSTPTKETSTTKYNIRDLLNSNPPKSLQAAKIEAPATNYKVTLPDIKNKITDEIKSMGVSDEDKEFLIKMAQAESGFNPTITNSLGYYGLYQFGKSALQSVGMTKKDFDVTLNQHKAALKLADQNEKVNKRIFDKYIGTMKDGVLITRNGLRAAHALLGAGGVREWLEGGTKTWTAKHGHKDAYGTGPEKYLKMFV